MSAYIGLGMTQGAKGVQQYERGRATREAQQSEAQNRKKMSEMQLKEYASQAPLREQQNEQALAEARHNTRLANQQNLKSITFSAFDKYEADGDVRHLNNMLSDVKKNPIGANSGSNIVRYDELTDTPEIRQMMVGAGYADFDGILKDRKLNKSFVVTTGSDGKKQVWDVDKVYAASGYGKYMTEEKLKEAKMRAEISELTRKGESVSSIQAKEQVIKSMMDANPGMPRHKAWQAVTEIEKGTTQGQDITAIKLISQEEGIGVLEATKQYYDQKNGAKSTTDQEKFVQDFMTNNPNSTRTDAVNSYKNQVKTADSKNIAEVDQYKDELDSVKFLDADMSTMSTQDRANVHRKISKIETLLDIKLSNEDKRVMRDLNNLTKLGAIAGTELTPDETGILDSTLNSFKKYMFDEVGGSVATSAYETFRNIFRNSLYGASLTETEVKAFNAAAGTLGQKFQPALSRLNTQMKSIKSQLESIRDTNDPYISKFYLGKDIGSIDDAIRQIESRLDLVSTYKGKQTVTTQDVLDRDNRPSLESLFEGL